MEKRSDAFGIKLSNCPLISLRQEFNANHKQIANPEFRYRLRRGARPEPIDSSLFTWLGLPSGFLTILLQRAFAGIEAYVVGAAYVHIGNKSITELKAAIEKLKDPFALGGRGVPDNYYNRVPALASEHYPLENLDPPLWEATRILYTQVRNPVFHGYEVDADHAHGVLAVYDHLADLYRWIDLWCDPNSIIPGAGAVLAPKPRGAA